MHNKHIAQRRITLIPKGSKVPPRPEIQTPEPAAAVARGLSSHLSQFWLTTFRLACSWLTTESRVWVMCSSLLTRFSASASTAAFRQAMSSTTFARNWLSSFSRSFIIFANSSRVCSTAASRCVRSSSSRSWDFRMSCASLTWICASFSRRLTFSCSRAERRSDTECSAACLSSAASRAVLWRSSWNSTRRSPSVFVRTSKLACSFAALSMETLSTLAAISAILCSTVNCRALSASDRLFTSRARWRSTLIASSRTSSSLCSSVARRASTSCRSSAGSPTSAVFTSFSFSTLAELWLRLGTVADSIEAG
eukprot:RCo038361